MAQGGRGCLRVGCLGCIGTAVLLAVAAVTVVAVGLLIGSPDREIEHPRILHELPRLPAGTVPDDRGDRTTDPSPSGGRTRGRVVIDLAPGEFELVPGRPGEALRLDGTFDRGRYELLEQLTREDDGSWSYRIETRRAVSWLRTLFDNDENGNRLKLVVPREVEFVLEARVGAGVSRFELGGLAVRQARFSFAPGEHSVGFARPVPVAMRRLTVDGSIGELRVTQVGNAGPEEFRTSLDVGSLTVDLQGAWRRDAEVDVRCGLGECGLRLPQDVVIELESASVLLGEENTTALFGRPIEEPGRPTVRLSIAAQVGELRVTR